MVPEEAFVNLLNLNQWDFYILRASALDKFPTQKMIALSTLLTLKPDAVSYDGIAACVEAMESEITSA